MTKFSAKPSFPPTFDEAVLWQHVANIWDFNILIHGKLWRWYIIYWVWRNIIQREKRLTNNKHQLERKGSLNLQLNKDLLALEVKKYITRFHWRRMTFLQNLSYTLCWTGWYRIMSIKHKFQKFLWFLKGGTKSKKLGRRCEAKGRRAFV